MSHKFFLAVILACELLPLHADLAPPPAPTTGSIALLDIIQDSRLVQSLYPGWVKRGHEVDAAGALGSINQAWETSQTGPWFIEEQRHAGDLMQAGIALPNPQLVQDAIRAVQWGLGQMQPDGSFNCPDQVHSSELFLEGAARCATLLRAAKPVPDADKIVADWLPKLQQIAQWLIQARQKQTPDERAKQLERYNHRFFASAAGIGMTAALLPDKNLASAADNLAREGLAKEQPGAIFPEAGGFDANYQAVTGLMASRFYTVCDDPALRGQLGPAVARSLGPIMDRTGPDGTVDNTGSTRTDGQETGRNGKLKHFGYSDYFLALVAADRIQPSDRLKENIQKVAAHLAAPAPK